MVLAIVCAHATSAAFTRLERRGPLYYVDGHALTNGDGSESRPFNTLAAVPSEPDSTIYLAGRLRESVEWTGNRDGSALRQWEGRPQAELRGDVVVPPVQWRAESATLWSTSISAAPASVVWNWDENIDEHGRHFGHLPLAASQQACESAEAGWYFDEPNFVLYVNPPPGAANPDAGDTYAWVRRGSGLTIRNGRDFTIDRLVVRLWSDPTPNNGYGIKLSDAVNFTISNCLAEDCGYHSIGFVGSTCERNRLVACVGRGLHGRSNHFVFYSNGGNITKCEAVDCEAHLYSILAWDGRKLDSEDRTGGYFTHTGGDATIDDIEFRSCSALGYTGFVGNAFGVGVTTRTTSDSRNAFTYPVRFVACRAVNCDYVNVAGHVAFVRCRLDFRKAAQSGGNSASTFVFNRSPTQVLIESSEIITRLDGVLVSRAIWPKNAGDVLLLLGNTFFDDGAERGTRSFVRVNETNQIVAEQCVFASQQAMHLTDGAADVSAENLAFANC